MLKENNKSFQIPFIPDFSSVVKERTRYRLCLPVLLNEEKNRLIVVWGETALFVH